MGRITVYLQSHLSIGPFQSAYKNKIFIENSTETLQLTSKIIRPCLLDSFFLLRLILLIMVFFLVYANTLLGLLGSSCGIAHSTLSPLILSYEQDPS